MLLPSSSVGSPRSKNRSTFLSPVRLGFLGAALAVVLPEFSAVAIPTDPESEPTGCLAQITGTISASATTIAHGGSTTISWNTSSSMTGCAVYVEGPRLSRFAASGTALVTPDVYDASNPYVTYTLEALQNGHKKLLGTVVVTIQPPVRVYGRATVRIDWDTEVDRFIQAIQTPNTTVILADDLNLDITEFFGTHIAPGVHILGGRSSTTLGPRLFTTERRHGPFFMIGEYVDADGVRIVGIRFDGGIMGIASDDDPIGIRIRSSVNVEIANCEIYGWAGIAVQVLDERGRLNLENASSVWIHDNYIHHNRHWRQQGYGVQTNQGAYALIERNELDYNRHALMSSGGPGNGYLAYNNLLGTNGGENLEVWPYTDYTHQFDVHGTAKDWLGRDAYAGHAGEYFDYRYNVLMYVRANGIKIRGTPTIRADVAHNSFSLRGIWAHEPFEQTDGNNISDWDNLEFIIPTWQDDVCDFDGDGTLDDFMATTRNWWFRGATGHAWFLNTSAHLGSELSFWDATGDGRCDVIVNQDGRVFSGGRTPWSASSFREAPVQRTDLVWQPGAGGGAARRWTVQSGGLGQDFMVNDVTAPDSLVLGTGDFNGDGAADLLRRNAQGAVSVSLLDEFGGLIDPIADRSPTKGVMPLTVSFAGIGDFDADGRSDVLWRHSDGQCEIWFAGEQGNSAWASWLNDFDELGRPKRAHDPVPAYWSVKGVGDFDGDGFSDILWRSDQGQVSIWYMHHAMHVAEANPGGTDPSHQWEIEGVGDFDGDGRDDILWRHVGGALAIWYRGLYEFGQGYPTWQNRPGWVVGQDWQVHGVSDFDADGRADILWRHDTGVVAIWRMAGSTYLGELPYMPIDPAWQLRGFARNALDRIGLQ